MKIDDKPLNIHELRVRVRERLGATPGHVIGQGPAPEGGVVPRGGSGGGGGGGGVLQTSLACTVKLTRQE